MRRNGWRRVKAVSLQRPRGLQIAKSRHGATVARFLLPIRAADIRASLNVPLNEFPVVEEEKEIPICRNREPKKE